MNDFKDCYQTAVNDMGMPGMKELHIDASSCMDEDRHNRWVIRQMRRMVTTAFSAACLVFLCGFGTVKAAEYIGNVIKVNEWGFESADAATMARNKADNTGLSIISEEVGLAVDEDAKSEMSGEDEAAAAGLQKSVGGEEGTAADSPLEGDAKYGGEAALPEAHTLNDEVEDGAVSQKKGAEEEMEGMQVSNYSSLVEFEENEDIIFPQPLINVGAESVSFTVCGGWAMARYDTGGKVVWVERTDYAGTSGHASSKVFPGGVCNERQYTTKQGYTYTLVDSVKEEGEQLQIHGAVTVGSYEAYIDFMGYTEEEAVQVIESINLSEYEQ